MKIENLRLEADSQWQTLSAHIRWNSPARPAQSIYFRVPAGALSMRRHVNPFVMAAAVPAMAAGESRIELDEPVDPVLFEGLPSALAIVRYWCTDIADGWRQPEISAPIAALNCKLDRGTAIFFSGGVDATFTLLKNHQLLGSPTRGRIATALLVYGLDLGYREDREDRSAFDTFLEGAGPELVRRGVNPIPVMTNLRQLDPRSGFWGRAFNGFALSALAQLFPDHLEQVLIGTSGERLSDTVQHHWGSHPVLHNYLNTSATQSRSPYVEYSRLHRIGQILQDQNATRQLRVCFNSTKERQNCGVCEKCIRTRIAIRLHGHDSEVGFGGPPLSSKLIRTVTISSRVGQAEHEELRDGLLAAGEKELAAAEFEVLARWYKYEAWRTGRSFKGRLKAGVNRIFRRA